MASACCLELGRQQHFSGELYRQVAWGRTTQDFVIEVGADSKIASPMSEMERMQ